ncbi:hypothetical protein LTR70_004082 [Exophiala xenobiotica]|uniref:Uncharacterized protein n=1 Tax=Lithohypha guttulata TaxID=1690604 RepID=A0ABR0KEJ5_9EURO|nr:hypothetical protein LTR24_003638 [Lithohypha guttulata]KAK5321527.1 hypothetical protein LTR70_004082 [Exophiala xenobiotica]
MAIEAKHAKGSVSFHAYLKSAPTLYENIFHPALNLLTTGRYKGTDIEEDSEAQHSVKVWHSMSVIHGASAADSQHGTLRSIAGKQLCWLPGFHDEDGEHINSRMLRKRVTTAAPKPHANLADGTGKEVHNVKVYLRSQQGHVLSSTGGSRNAQVSLHPDEDDKKQIPLEIVCEDRSWFWMRIGFEWSVVYQHGYRSEHQNTSKQGKKVLS